jgi:hypothetical protein
MSNPWFLERLTDERQREFLGWDSRRTVSSSHRAASPHRGRGAGANLLQRVRGVRRSGPGSTPERGHRRHEPFKLAASAECLPSAVGRGR